MKKGLLALAAGLILAGSADAAKVYYDNTKSNWSEVHAWVWGGGENGADVTLVKTATDEGELWVLDATKDYTGIIFKGDNTWNKKWNGGDGVFKADAIYNVDGYVKQFGGEAPAPEQFDAMYVVGTMNSWSKSDLWKMSTEDGEVYTITKDLDPAAEFKFYGGEWGLREFGGASFATLPAGFEAKGNDKNIYTADGLNNATITLNIKNSTLTIVGEGGGDDPQPPTPPVTDYQVIYLIGSLNGWNLLDNDLKMATTDGKVYTVKVNALASGDEFKFNDGTWAKEWSPSFISELPEGISASGTNFKADRNFANATITLDIDAKTLKVEGDDTPIVVEKYYALHGQIFGDPNWSSMAFEDKEGVLTLAATLVAGDFGIKVCSDAACTKQTGWIGGDQNIAVAGAYEMVEGANSNSKLEGYHVITYNPESGLLSISAATDPSGVEEIAAEGEAIYFNLQGARVANPVNGIYVKVLNGKTSKVVVK